MDVREKAIREEIGELSDQMEAIVNLAETEKRDLTEEEDTEYEALEKQAKAEKKKLDRHMALQESRNQQKKKAEDIDEAGKVEVKDNKLDSKEALLEHTAQIYRALCSPNLDVVQRQKMLTEATSKLAEGGHYGNRARNAVDAFSTLVDDKGGIFIPQTISDQIMSIAREYGVFPARAMNVPLDVSRGRLRIPNYTGELTFHAVNQGSEVASSTTSFKGIELEVLKWMCVVPWTNEMDSLASARLVPIVNNQLGEAWAGIIDDAVINGDGTSTYHNKKGFVNRSADAAAPEVRRSTAASGNLSFATIDQDDFINATLDVAPGVRSRSVFVLHPDWNVYLAQIKDTEGRPLFLSGGVISRTGDQWSIYGYPVYFSEKMPNTSGTEATYGLFFNPSYLAFGDAGGFMAQQLTEASILASDGSTRIYLASQDMQALLVKGFFDFEFSPLTVSSGGNTLGAFTLLRTSAS